MSSLQDQAVKSICHQRKSYQLHKKFLELDKGHMSRVTGIKREPVYWFLKEREWR